MTTVAEFVFDRVVQFGVRHVFVLPGGGAMHLVDALARESRLEPIPLLHEQAVGIAAEAYGQYGDAPGVALVTTGPGSTNALTAVAAAWLDSTPCVFISGQVKTADLATGRGLRQFGFQEIDIVAMAAPITKAAIRLLDAGTAADEIDRVVSLATSGRPGPVWIDIPLDIQAAEVGRSHDGPVPIGADCRPIPDPDIVADVARALVEATRPLLLLGNGVRLSGAEDLALSWARRIGIPVATTWKGLDLIAWDDELFAGRPGAIASHYANFAQQGADVIVAIGARLDLGQTGYRHDTFGNRALKVVVDIDESELGKLEFDPYLPIRADASEFMVCLNAATRDLDRQRWAPWRARIREWRRRFPLDDPEELLWDDGLSVYVLIEILSNAMGPEFLFVPGSSGACSEVSMQTFQNKTGQRVLNSEGLGPMGFGIPAALGACIASGGRPTVCVDGDGGFAMNVQDLVSVTRLALPIKFFVLDNDGYGSIRTTSDNYFEGRKVGCDEESGLRIPNYREVGPVMGIETRTVGNVAELRAAVGEVLFTDGPSLVIVKVSERQRTRPRVTSRRLEGGRMETAPLEFLVPSAGVSPQRELSRPLGGPEATDCGAQ